MSTKNVSEHCVESLTGGRGTLTRGAFSRAKPVASGRPSECCSHAPERAGKRTNGYQEEKQDTMPLAVFVPARARG